MSKFSKNTTDAMVMTASQFDSLTDEEIDRLPALPLVIARCAPDTKVRMIEALHRRKKFAAMVCLSIKDLENFLINLRLATVSMMLHRLIEQMWALLWDKVAPT